MAKLYFKKELVSRKINSKKGVPIPFEKMREDYGLIALDDDDDLVSDLRAYITKRQGGVYEISEVEYEADKKKLAPVPFEQSSNPHKKGPRIFDPASMVPTLNSPAKPVATVEEPAKSPPAVEKPGIVPLVAAAADGSPVEIPIGILPPGITSIPTPRGRKVNLGKAKAAPKPDEGAAGQVVNA